MDLAPVPQEFHAALRLMMPEGGLEPSPGERAWFPAYDPDALEFGHRLFWAEPGAMPGMDFEIEVEVRAGTLRARGRWHGAEVPGEVTFPDERIWLLDPHGFNVVRVVRRRPAGAEET